MKRRFPVLAYGMRIHIGTAQKLISIAAMLHNICIDSNEAEPPVLDEMLEHIIDEINRFDEDNPVGNENENNRIDGVRRRLAREEILEMIREGGGI